MVLKDMQRSAQKRAGGTGKLRLLQIPACRAAPAARHASHDIAAAGIVPAHDGFRRIVLEPRRRFDQLLRKRKYGNVPLAIPHGLVEQLGRVPQVLIP